MPKSKQISIRGTTYAQVKAYCEREGLSVAKFIDALCVAHLNGQRPGRRPGSENGENLLFTEEEKASWKEK
jgi:hypothetical protein